METRSLEAFDQEQLLADLQAGKDEAYQRFLVLFGGRVHATALRLVKNEEDANDVFQETFLSAFKAIARFEGKSQLSTWLHRICVNAALMKLRAKERKPQTELESLVPRFSDSGQFAEPVAPWSYDADAPALRREATRLVRSCIQKLPDNYRVAIVLRDIEGLDNEAVAQHLGLTVNAAKIRVHRARQALRTLLEPYVGATAACASEREVLQ